MKTLSLGLVSLLVGASVFAASRAENKFTDHFGVEKGDLVSAGTNRFFNLTPGFQTVYEGKEGGKSTVLTITVLNETKLVDGVETRVVVEHETAGGQLIEVSSNYFAISKCTGDVFYFGEDVDMFKNGVVVNHEGSWLSGVNSARFGLAMPATPLLGARYCQEIAPKVAMDQGEIASLVETVDTPAGKFENCLKVAESSALESARENKFYAPGVGLVFDGSLKLVRMGYVKK